MRKVAEVSWPQRWDITAYTQVGEEFLRIVKAGMMEGMNNGKPWAGSELCWAVRTSYKRRVEYITKDI